MRAVKYSKIPDSRRKVMILTSDMEEAGKTVVLFNGKPMKQWMAAEDGEQGWVEILDIGAMAPLELNEGVPGEDDLPDFQSLQTKIKRGKVEFVKI